MALVPASPAVLNVKVQVTGPALPDHLVHVALGGNLGAQAAPERLQASGKLEGWRVGIWLEADA